MRSLLFIDIETFTAANLEFVSLGHFYSTHVLHIFTCLDREPFHQCADISQRIIILDGKSFFFFFAHQKCLWKESSLAVIETV